MPSLFDDASAFLFGSPEDFGGPHREGIAAAATGGEGGGASLADVIQSGGLPLSVLQRLEFDAVQSGDEGRLRRIRDIMGRRGRDVQEQILPAEDEGPPRLRVSPDGVEFDLFPELNQALQTSSLEDLVLGSRLT